MKIFFNIVRPPCLGLLPLAAAGNSGPKTIKINNILLTGDTSLLPGDLLVTQKTQTERVITSSEKGLLTCLVRRKDADFIFKPQEKPLDEELICKQLARGVGDIWRPVDIQNIVAANLTSFSSDKFQRVLKRESMKPDKSGRLTAFVNGFMDENGFIKYFGNALTLPNEPPAEVIRALETGQLFHFLICTRVLGKADYELMLVGEIQNYWKQTVPALAVQVMAFSIYEFSKLRTPSPKPRPSC